MNPKLLLAIAAILMALALVFVGCSGSGGPAMPSPATPDRPDPTPIVVENLIIPADEERLVQEDTVFTVEGVVQIDGALIGADASGAGAHGVDITIEAEGDISVTGLVQAGSGTDGASDEAGGDGGSVSLTSTGGSITVGAEGEVAVAGSGKSGVHAGDAGAGGNGLLGGPGGQGGSVLLACAAGTLTIHEAPGLFHVGNGGHGGDGLVTGRLEEQELPAELLVPFEGSEMEDYLAELFADDDELEEPDEGLELYPVLLLPNRGGDSGLLVMDAQELIGLEQEETYHPEVEPAFLVFSSVELLSGGVGGNGGSFTERSEQVGEAALRPGHTTSPSGLPHDRVAQRSGQGSEDRRMSYFWYASRFCSVQGPHGGRGERQGGNAGEVNRDDGGPARGGMGGWIHGNEQSFGAFFKRFWYVHKVLRAGHGGDVTVTSAAGAAGGDCQDGDLSQACLAVGGEGGHIAVWRFSDSSNVSMFAGRGGHAKAISGNGGAGGDCCGNTPPGRGGRGGNAGGAEALGGKGGEIMGTSSRITPILIVGPTRYGPGGNGEGRSGNGGSGGAGAPPGKGGVAFRGQGEGGEGEPRGSGLSRTGRRGADGNPCPEAPAPEPGPTPDPPTEYGITTSNSPAQRIEIFPGIYVAAQTAQQLQPDVTIGGPGNRVLPPLGASVVFKRDNSLLWAVDELSGTAMMFSNPLTGGNRAADVTLDLGTEMTVRALWYEESADVLYATSGLAPTIFAWDGASAGASGRAPTRQITIADYVGSGRLTGAPGSNRLFVAARTGTLLQPVHKILVYHNAHAANGAREPDAVIEPAFDFDIHAMAWDAERDILYLGRRNQLMVDVYTNASTLSGAVVPTRSVQIAFVGIPQGDFITALVAAPEHDLLFVSLFGGAAFGGSEPQGSVLVYRNASGLVGTPAPDARRSFDHMALSLGLFRQ